MQLNKNEKEMKELSYMIRKKDEDTYMHCIRVARNVNQYCKFYNIDDTTTEDLFNGALLHDIGKIFIDDSILRKPTKLTNEEYDKIRNHTFLGYQFLKSQGINRDIYIYALYHHYRVDNKNANYDFSSKVDASDLLSNKDNINKYWYGICLLNICDSYDAMTQRSYNKPKSVYEAIEEIKRCTNTQFQQRIAKKFIKYLECTIAPNNVLKKILCR